MEHHLGMTCDPIGGLVQIPCIELDAFGANQPAVAASLSMGGDGIHRLTLDEVIETTRQTDTDLQVKYKETSQGGLVLNVVACRRGTGFMSVPRTAPSRDAAAPDHNAI